MAAARLLRHYSATVMQRVLGYIFGNWFLCFIFLCDMVAFTLETKLLTACHGALMDLTVELVWFTIIVLFGSS